MIYLGTCSKVVIVVVQLLHRVQLFATPWTAAHQAPPSSTISWSLLTFLSIESVMLTKHLILCRPLLLLPSIFPSIRVFSNESALCIRWPKYWNFSMSPSNENSGLIFFKIDWLDLLAVKRLPRGFSSTTDWKHQIFSTQPSLWSNSHIHMYSESTWMCILPLLGGMFYKCWSVG